MKERWLALAGWSAMGGLAVGLCPVLWWHLTHRPTSSCYGLWDVSLASLMAMPVRTLWHAPEVWPCALPFVLMPAAGLVWVVRSPRGPGWVLCVVGWLAYSVDAVLLMGVGC